MVGKVSWIVGTNNELIFLTLLVTVFQTKSYLLIDFHVYITKFTLHSSVSNLHRFFVLSFIKREKAIKSTTKVK